MTHHFSAIYEHGAFRPVGGIDMSFPEGTEVQLSIESPTVKHEAMPNKPFPTFDLPSDARPVNLDDVQRAAEDVP